MGSEGQTTPRYHVLLIGIDNYPIKPLAGCVNDIDAVQRILLDSGLGIPIGSIRRLASPLPRSTHATSVSEEPATFENIRKALAVLASDTVQRGDRVFIYYSGHGKRVPVTGDNGKIFQREALVPVDFLRANDVYEWLFDFEVNQRLRAIVERTASVTVVLDCCHAAGTSRADEKPDELRTLDQLELAAVPDPVGARGEVDGDAAWLSRGIAACHVVAACLANEFARETTEGDVRHGLLTRSFVAALGRIPTTGLPAITWGRIWNAMRAEVMRGNPSQTPRMEGNARRIVFAGPPVDGDAGIPVTLGDDGASYRVEAGTIAEITNGAELAVYGPDPARFPALGSATERAARLGVIRVTRASLGDAEAAAVDTWFDLPPGARGRLVKPGATEPLRWAIEPVNPEIAKHAAGAELIKVVGPDDPTPLRLLHHNGQWLLIDELHGTGDGAPVLFTVRSDELVELRAVLEHYHRYSLPMRMAKRAAADLTDGLELKLIRCVHDTQLDAEQIREMKLDEVAMDKDGLYQVSAGAAVCVYVRNRSTRQLKVALVDATAAGEVLWLGDEMIDPDQVHVFWAQSNTGMPFKMRPEVGATRSRDRLIAIGRTDSALELDHLRLERTFADVVGRTRDGNKRMDDGADRRMDDGAKAAATHRWTAAQIVIETREA